MDRLKRYQTLLGLGIALRILTFAFLAPQNNDVAHLTTIQFIAERREIPLASQTGESFQPPLYYVLAAPIWHVSRTAKAVQLLSLIFSIGTLLVLGHLIYRRSLISGEKARLYCMLLACFLPQFVMFGLYVSNDSLAMFLGAVVVLQVARFIEKPDRQELLLLALSVGAGLLTKASFLPFLPVLLALVIFVYLRRGYSHFRTTAAAAAFLALSLAIGSYKFVQNWKHFKTPIASNLDAIGAGPRQGGFRDTYRGLGSFVDFNVARLLASPTVSKLTESSYPLLLYGTFWYQHIPESNFHGNRRVPFNYLGSVIYLFALAPAAAFVLGAVALLRGMPRFCCTFEPEQEDNRRLLVTYLALFFLLGNLGVLIFTILRYHAWSIMQARLMFPSFYGMLATFGFGVNLVHRFRRTATALEIAMRTLVGLFALYFASEMSYLFTLSLSSDFAALLRRIFPLVQH